MKNNRPFQIFATLVLSLGVCGSVEYARAARTPHVGEWVKRQAQRRPIRLGARQLRPEWLKHKPAQLAPNTTFLQATQKDPALYEPSFNDELFGPSLRKNITLEYNDMTRDYEMRKNYDLTTTQDDVSYVGKLMDFTRHILLRVFHGQIKKNVDNAEKNSTEVRTFRTVQRTAEAVANGEQPVSAGPFFTFRTYADFRNYKGTLWMATPVLDSSFAFDLKAPSEDPNMDPILKDQEKKKERFTVSVSRQIPLVDVSGGLSYGINTTVMRASVSKLLVRNLSAEVASTQAVDPSRTLLPPREESLSVNYRLSF